MYIYSGKLNYLEYAQNEHITIVVPAGFALKDPISVYWQWTVDAEGVEKRNMAQSGIINTVTKTTSKYQISFRPDFYSFEAIVADDFSTLTTTMLNPEGARSDTMTLVRQHGDGVRVPSTSVFTGKLDWFEYATNEMITLVIPDDVSSGAPVGLYYQWTVADNGTAKENHLVNSTFRDVASSQGEAKGEFDDGYHTFEVTMLNDQQEATIRMSSPNGGTTESTLKQTDFRGLDRKKALIIRFGTGTDNGIFLVQEMLTKHLGFAPGDIEMCYFDIEPEGGNPGQCTKGQDPPTATRFKEKFTNLLSSALAGQVRFLYVDAHGTTFPDEEGSGEPDEEDEGWVFAENDEGTRKEILKDDWLGNNIRTNIKPGVNLTILTSSCMGGGMLDTHTATPGVLLAGCHETQFNVKALRVNNQVIDPWMYAITRVIASHTKRKRTVPQYSVLFNQAKKFIQQLISGGQIDPNSVYKGASPDENNPVPYDPAAKSSNQDPQLIFYNGYLDPDTEKFLSPFVTANGGDASGEATRYPRDEL